MHIILRARLQIQPCHSIHYFVRPGLVIPVTQHAIVLILILLIRLTALSAPARLS